MELGEVRIMNSPGKVYAKRSLNSAVVGTYKAGNRVTILGRPSIFARSWAYVGVGQHGNYTAKGFVDIRDSRDFVPAPPKATKTRGELYFHYLTYVAYSANPDRLHDYIWGAEGQDANHDGDPEWDCSGLHHAALRYSGYPDERTTANGYKGRSKHITGPTMAGDAAFLLRADGTAHHIINYAGGSTTIEARGAAYGIERHTVANANSRGAVWGRDERVAAFMKQPAE